MPAPRRGPSPAAGPRRPTSCRALPRGDRIKNLDFLFEALKAAPDADTAKLVESRIWALWLASGSDTADLLMSRVKTAIDAKDNKLAIQLLDAVVELKPDYVEAWNRRATIHFANKDSASRSPTSARCWRASRAISARCPASA